MIMIVGLPGAGKTTWGINMQRDNFDKRYNIIGTDTLIDKMKVWVTSQLFQISSLLTRTSNDSFMIDS